MKIKLVSQNTLLGAFELTVSEENTDALLEAGVIKYRGEYYTYQGSTKFEGRSSHHGVPTFVKVPLFEIP